MNKIFKSILLFTTLLVSCTPNQSNSLTSLDATNSNVENTIESAITTGTSNIEPSSSSSESSSSFWSSELQEVMIRVLGELVPDLNYEDNYRYYEDIDQDGAYISLFDFTTSNIMDEHILTLENNGYTQFDEDTNDDEYGRVVYLYKNSVVDGKVQIAQVGYSDGQGVDEGPGHDIFFWLLDSIW